MHTCAPVICIFYDTSVCFAFIAVRSRRVIFIVHALPSTTRSLARLKNWLKYFFKYLKRCLHVCSYVCVCERLWITKSQPFVCARAGRFYDGLNRAGKVSWIHTKAIKMPFTHSRISVGSHHNKNGENMNLSSDFNLLHIGDPFSLPASHPGWGWTNSNNIFDLLLSCFAF